MQIHRYTPAISIDDDIRIISWWNRMRLDGDLEATFAHEITPSKLFASLHTEVLLYTCDEAGAITVASWFADIHDAATFGAWVRADRRTSPSSLRAIVEMLRMAFEVKSTLVSITPHGHVVPELERLGYTVLGALPGLLGPGLATAGYITRDDFNAALAAIGLRAEAA